MLELFKEKVYLMKEEEPMMKAMDCADYIVKRSIENDSKITNLQLQKILFLMAAEYQREEANYPFSEGEKFEAWGYGPVMPEVYQEYKGYESAPIETYKHDFFDYKTYQWEERNVDESDIDSKFKNIVNKYLDELLKINVFELVFYTHKQKFWINNKDTRNSKYPTSEVKFQNNDNLDNLIMKWKNNYGNNSLY